MFLPGSRKARTLLRIVQHADPDQVAIDSLGFSLSEIFADTVGYGYFLCRIRPYLTGPEPNHSAFNCGSELDGSAFGKRIEIRPHSA